MELSASTPRGSQSDDDEGRRSVARHDVQANRRQRNYGGPGSRISLLDRELGRQPRAERAQNGTPYDRFRYIVPMSRALAIACVRVRVPSFVLIRRK